MIEQPFILVTLFEIYKGGRTYVGKKIVDGFLSEMRRSQEFGAFSNAFDAALTQLVESERLANGEAVSIKRVLQLTREGELTFADSDRPTIERLANQLQDNFFLPPQRLDISPLVGLCKQVALWGNINPPSDATLAEGLAIFVAAMQEALFANALFRDEMLAHREFYILQQTAPDSRHRYLEQFIVYYQHLDFIGIPDLKDRNEVRLQDVFVQLAAEPEPQKQHKRRFVEDAVREELDEEMLPLEIRLEPQLGTQPKISVNEALKRQQKLMILGDPGAGKTTLLKYVALAFARDEAVDGLSLQEKRLPIFVKLSNFAAEWAARPADYDLIDYLYTAAKERLGVRHLSDTFFEDALRAGGCCVCLDGLDELGDSGLRHDVVRIVQNFASRYPRNRYLLSSRLVGYEDAPLNRQQFRHFVVQPFSEAEIRQFVTKWYAARETDPIEREDKTAHLLKTIFDEEPIQRLATNPLLLTIIALVHRIEAELPHERVALYRKCVSTLSEKWDKAKRIASDAAQPHIKYRQRLLEQLAHWMHTQPGQSGRAREVKEGTLRQKITQFLSENKRLNLDPEEARQQAEAFVQTAKSRTGLLVERGDQLYSFAHLTFQEYLAAVDIKKRTGVKGVEGIWEAIEPHLHDPHWREVLLLLMGSLNEYDEIPTLLVERILARQDRYEAVLPRHLFLAARILADRVDVNKSTEEEVINRLFNLIKQNKLSKYDAFTSLSRQTQSNLGMQKLFILIKDALLSDWDRREAANALSNFNHANNTILSGLLSLARDASENAWTRRDAIFAFSQLAHAEHATSNLLVLAWDTSVDAWTRVAAAQAVYLLGYANETITILLEIVRDASVDDKIRKEIYSGLNQFDQAQPRILSGLLAIGQDNSVNIKLRCEAILGLKQFDQAQPHILFGLLTIVLDSLADIGLRCNAALALCHFDQPDSTVLPSLLTFAQNSSLDIGLRCEIIKAISESDQADPTILSGLLALAWDEFVDLDLRCSAALAVSKLDHSAQGETILLNLAQNTRYSLPAILALQELGHARNLLALVMNSSLGVRPRGDALYSLRELNQAEPYILSNLFILAQDNSVDPILRGIAAGVLSHLSKSGRVILPDILVLTQKTLSDDRLHNVASSYYHLDQADNTILVNIQTLAQDPSVEPWIRGCAALVFIQLGQTELAHSILLAIVQDSSVSSMTLREVVLELGELSRADPTILYDLLAIAQDPSIGATIRRETFSILGELSQVNSTILHGLLAIAQDPCNHASIRCDSALALGELGHVDHIVLSGLLSLAQDTSLSVASRRDVYHSLKTLLQVTV